MLAMGGFPLLGPVPEPPPEQDARVIDASKIKTGARRIESPRIEKGLRKRARQ